MKTRLVTVAAILSLTAPLSAQEQPGPRTDTVVARLVVSPANLVVKAGETVPFKVTAFDASGNELRAARIRVSGPRNAVAVGDGQVTALRAGRYELIATAGGRAEPVIVRVPISITWPAVTRIALAAEPGRLYSGVTLAHTARAFHADSSERREAVVTWRSSNPQVATVDRFGNVTAVGLGPATITAEFEGVRTSARYTVVANPVSSLSIDVAENTVRSGDVLHLKAVARRASGAVIPDVPVTWSYTYLPDDTIAAPGATGIVDRGLFAAEVPGRYTLLATAGSTTARKVIQVTPRDVRKRINVTGRGSITHVNTSDLWPWTAKDGRDYALVGTWGGDGWGYVFDISNLAAPVITDSIQVNARTINDVTVSPDGRYGVLSREGASDRVNGVVILDLANPAHPKVAATFSQELTGGVHNMFATNDYLFAISGGDKYVIVDVRDIYSPKYLSEYNHPNSRVHDVWVRDGIAYSSEWG
ncbi:MAG: Ig-like domain-containing protein, partial [Gemmatimonadaceae bacterium]